MAATAARLRPYLLGWKAYFRLAQTPRVWRELDEWLRHRLRAIQLKAGSHDACSPVPCSSARLSPITADAVRRSARDALAVDAVADSWLIERTGPDDVRPVRVDPAGTCPNFCV
jgi:hypothetical protein